MTTSLWQVDPADAGRGAPADALRGGRGRRSGVPARRLAALHVQPPRSRCEARPGQADPRPVAAAAGRRRGAPPCRARGRRGRAGVARRAPVVAFGSGLHVGAVHVRRGRRARQGPQGGRRDGAPLRGRLPDPLLGSLAGAAPPASLRGRPAGRARDAPRGAPRPGAGRLDAGLRGDGADVTPDGRTVVSARYDTSTVPAILEDLVAYDVATGEARVLTPGDAWYDAPACSPDGRSVAALRVTRGSPETAQRVGLVLIDLATGAQRTLAADLDRWPNEPVWAPDGRRDLLHGGRRRPSVGLPGRDRRRG